MATPVEQTATSEDDDAPSSTPLSVGDVVRTLKYGRGTVVAALQTDAAQPFHGRVQVLWGDGSTYWTNPKKLRRLEQPTTRVVATETTRQYKQAVLKYIHPGDVVLEVGCHEGFTTALLHSRCAHIVGVDASVKPIDVARAKFPHVRFEVVDGRDVEKLEVLSPKTEGPKFDKVLVDIGGTHNLPAVMQLVGTYYRAWRGSVIIVKSVFFARFLTDAAAFQPNHDCLSAAGDDASRQRAYHREQRLHGGGAEDGESAGGGDGGEKEEEGAP